jgi:biotin transport system substrate-specific component
MVLSSLFAALTAVCAWIAIPLPGISFTMQTFAVLLTLGVLGGRWGTASISLYLLLGLVGLPVFTGFRGGAAALLDPTGGCLWGFLLGSLVYWILERLGRIPAMAGCLAVTYLCGSWWFSVYTGTTLLSAMAVSVLPWLIPDGIKLALANHMAKRICRNIRI